MKNAIWLFFRSKRRYVGMSLANVAINTIKNVDSILHITLMSGRHV